jgi:hypothetical protein
VTGWKDLLLETLKLADEVKRLNTNIEKLADRVVDIDKPVVRLETMVEIASMRQKRLDEE